MTAQVLSLDAHVLRVVRAKSPTDAQPNDVVYLDPDADQCVVRTVRSLAPQDAWHSWEGYDAFQEATMLCFHRDGRRTGEIFEPARFRLEQRDAA
tara:strand:+ start:1726 stop:2010 length:285 start_codon:yes stop_codon:yes gene_type:complete